MALETTIYGLRSSDAVLARIKQIPLSIASTTDAVTAVAAVSGSQIQVMGLMLSSDTVVNIAFKSGTTAITTMVLGEVGGVIHLSSSPKGLPLFCTDAGSALTVTPSASVANLFGFIQYRYIPTS